MLYVKKTIPVKERMKDKVVTLVRRSELFSNVV
jgi:hypothetical protein